MLSKPTPAEALKKLRRFCAYQERAHTEVREKLRGWGYWGAAADEMISKLLEEGLLNEERFGKAYAAGKFRQKGWGRRKIEMGLKAKGLNEYLVGQSMKQIDEDTYAQKLEEVLAKKLRLLKDTDPFIIKNKLFRYALSRGYEGDLVGRMVEKVMEQGKQA